MHNKKNTKSAFTLVELIVVITILAILSTIGFVSFSGYLAGTRDVNRISQIKAMGDALELYRTKKTLPIPDDKVNISFSGTLIAYQGYIGKNVLETIEYTESGLDPKYKTYFSYYLTKNKKYFQLMTMLEEENSDKESALNSSFNPKVLAEDYSERTPFVKGKKLGILTDENNTPIQEVETVKAAGEFEMLTGTFSGSVVKSFFSNTPITTIALKIGGQLQTVSKNTNFSSPDKCPKGYIPVPGNGNLGQPGFCVGKYEASVEGANIPGTAPCNDLGNGTCGISKRIEKFVSKEGKVPTTDIGIGVLPIVDLFRCSLQGKGYHMITVNERLTIARNIEKVGQNWSGGKVSNGHIKTGNSGNATTGFDIGDNMLASGTNGNTTQDELRQLKLSNGEIIWDFVGNVWEIASILNTNDSKINEHQIPNIHTWIKKPIEGHPTSGYHNFSDISNINYIKYFGPQTSTDNSAGFGKTRIFSSGAGYYVFGGDATGGDENGLYSIVNIISMGYKNIGTRCTYSKN